MTCNLVDSHSTGKLAARAADLTRCRFHACRQSRQYEEQSATQLRCRLVDVTCRLTIVSIGGDSRVAAACCQLFFRRTISRKSTARLNFNKANRPSAGERLQQQPPPRCRAIAACGGCALNCSLKLPSGQRRSSTATPLGQLIACWRHR